MTAMIEGTDEVRPGAAAARSGAFTQFSYSVISLIGTIVLWQILIDLLDVPVYFFPAPSDIGRALYNGADLYFDNYLITLYRTFFAFGISFLLGAGLGVLVSEVRIVSITVYPVLIALQSMPKVALAPIFIVWFGFGSLSKVVLGAFSAFFPIFLNTLHGLKVMDAEQLALMKSLGASPLQTFFKVKLPSALPFILAGANIGIIYSTLAVIVAEFLGSNNGMGYLIINQSNQMDTAGVFANVVILSATGLIFHYGLQYIRGKLIFW